MAAETVAVVPGAYVYAEYCADWEGDDLPREDSEVDLGLEFHPVVAIVRYPPESDDYVPSVQSLYLKNGKIVESENTPIDFGEDEVGVGVFSADVPEADVRIQAFKTFWIRVAWHRREMRREAAQVG
jgi:hypothetical protein